MTASSHFAAGSGASAAPVASQVRLTITLPLPDGNRIRVPDDLNLITPYVLMEQGDWFEDEIHFVRQLLQPGERAVDIGANLGIYTLAMARAVGPQGAVRAFEPSSQTAALLAESLALNKHEHVVLDRSAVSDRVGTAHLGLHTHSELNELVRAGDGSGPPPVAPGGLGAASEEVALTTLDAIFNPRDEQPVDFLKLDAEGEEARILAGGTRFFGEGSPLVMYEVRAGHDLHLDLVTRFSEMGYACFRLVPGLQLLAPFDPAAGTDGYLLNLFACKPDREALLQARGLLVSAPLDQDDPWQGVPDPTAYGWTHSLAALPYGQALSGHWRAHTAQAGNPGVLAALALYALSRDGNKLPAQRLAALRASGALLAAACRSAPSGPRLASLARVAADLGERVTALRAVAQLALQLNRVGTSDPTEPFLAPTPAFDKIDPRGDVGRWILAAALEAQERLGSHSGWFVGESARSRLLALQELGFATPDMRRRLQLLQARFGVTPAATV